MMLGVTNTVLRVALPLIDALLPVLLVPDGPVMRAFRRLDASRLPMTKACLMRLGVFSLRYHYYEPMFYPRHLRHSLARMNHAMDYLKHRHHAALKARGLTSMLPANPVRSVCA